MTHANEILQHRIKKAQELAKSKVSEGINYRTYLGKPTTMSALSTSNNKDRAKRKLQRQNRKKGRR